MNYIKMSPLAGLSGYGGGTTAHTFAGIGYGPGTGKWTGQYGYFFGGDGPGSTGEVNWIRKCTIDTTGNASDSGDLQNLAKRASGASSGDYCFNFGGLDDNVLRSNTISRWSGTGGNSSSFTTMEKGMASTAACCDGVRLVMGGGQESETGSPNTNWRINRIEYYNPADGSETVVDFGDLSANVSSHCATNSATRGVFMGGYTTTSINEIQYITFQQESNSSDFGDLTTTRTTPRAAGSETRGVLAGGTGDTDGIEYITFDTTGNATSFGVFSNSRSVYGGGASSDLSRMVYGGGWTGGHGSWIDYFTIASAGDGTDFGDLPDGQSNIGGCSGG